MLETHQRLRYFPMFDMTGINSYCLHQDNYLIPIGREGNSLRGG